MNWAALRCAFAGHDEARREIARGDVAVVLHRLDGTKLVGKRDVAAYEVTCARCKVVISPFVIDPFIWRLPKPSAS